MGTSAVEEKSKPKIVLFLPYPFRVRLEEESKASPSASDRPQRKSTGPARAAQ